MPDNLVAVRLPPIIVESERLN